MRDQRVVGERSARDERVIASDQRVIATDQRVLASDQLTRCSLVDQLLSTIR